MLTYSEAQVLLAKGRHRRRKIANNTYLVPRQDGDIAVKLHATDVVTLHSDGGYTLRSGGWRTMVTRDRINRYIPFGRLDSQRGEWRVYPKWSGWRSEGPAYPWAEGIKVQKDRTVEGAGEDLTALRQAMLKRIKRYVDGYAEHVKANGLDDPGPGDCWGCYMNARPADGSRVAPPPGESFMGVDHLLSHFEEEYYVPSLLYRAVERRGNPSFCYHMIREDAKRGDTRMLKRELRGYFRRVMPALVEAGGGAYLG